MNYCSKHFKAQYGRASFERDESLPTTSMDCPTCQWIAQWKHVPTEDVIADVVRDVKSRGVYASPKLLKNYLQTFYERNDISLQQIQHFLAKKERQS